MSRLTLGQGSSRSHVRRTPKRSNAARRMDRLRLVPNLVERYFVEGGSIRRVAVAFDAALDMRGSGVAIVVAGVIRSRRGPLRSRAATRGWDRAEVRLDLEGFAADGSTHRA